MSRQHDPTYRVSFEEHADSFESRSALPDGVPEQVAWAVRDYAGLGPEDLIVEVGAGTGMIGQWLARLPGRYLGLDNSPAMLEVFAPRLAGNDTASVRHTDVNQPWPVPDRSARAIFGSRVFQLLDVDHLVAEANRVAHAHGAILIEGKFEMGRTAPKVVIRTKLRELLNERGLRPRQVQRLLRQVLRRADAAGGGILPPRTVATWQWPIRPQEVIDAWRLKGSMVGITPPAEVATAILDELTSWATGIYGDLTVPVSSEESYVLAGVQLRPDQRR